MSLNFDQIPPLTTKLAANELLKNKHHHFFLVAIDPILFNLAGNEDMHILDEFEFRPDWTIDYRVSCPFAGKKYPHRIGKMVSPPFLCYFGLDPFMSREPAS